LKFFP
jgi:ubiquinol-cytochrome c reductase iron-sulfur subunit